MAIYSIEQYKALTASIAQGVTSVEYADKKVNYRSLDEMKQIKRDMEIDLGIKKPGIRRVYTNFNSGL